MPTNQPLNTSTNKKGITMKNRQQTLDSIHQMSFDRIYNDQEAIDLAETFSYESSFTDYELRKIEEKYSALGTARRKEHRP